MKVEVDKLSHPSSAGNIGRALKELQQKQQLLQVNDS